MRAASAFSFVSTACCMLGGFAYLTRAVSRRDVVAADKMLRGEVQKARVSEGDGFAEAVGPIGKEWFHAPVAAVLSLPLWRRGAGAGSVAPLLASAASELTSRGFDRLHLRTVPPGHPHPRKPSFPSGQALETSAVALTAAYTLAREGDIKAVPAFVAAGTLALATSAGRVYLDRHWVSDAIGGFLIGTAIAAGCSALYEGLSDDPEDRAGQRQFHRRRSITQNDVVVT